MKTFLLLILAICFSKFSVAQYRIFESPRNEIHQTIVRTSDKGYLIVAHQFCYTPEEWVIEGCPLGIRLIKTSESGDSLWSSVIPNTDVQGLLHAFQNRDGTFTIFTSQDRTLTCKGWQTGPDPGFFQMLTYHVSATGELLSQNAFPDECHLPLTTVTQLSDTTYIALATYLEPFASDTVEGRIYLLDHKGSVITSAVVPDQDFSKADVVTDSLNRILVFFMNPDSAATLRIYDHDLVMLQENISDAFSTPCMTAADTRGKMLMQDNGNLFYMCDDPFGKKEHVEVFTFTPNLSITGHKSYAIPLSANITEDEDGAIIILSEMRNEEDSSNITLTYLNELGDSIETISLRIPGNQNPTDLIAFDDERLAIVGKHNCCNYHADYGPGATFLYLQEGFISDVALINEYEFTIYPNPAQNEIYILESDRDGPGIVQIFNATGLPIKKALLTDNRISISELPPGMYYMFTILPDNTAGRARFVKQE